MRFQVTSPPGAICPVSRAGICRVCSPGKPPLGFRFRAQGWGLTCPGFGGRFAGKEGGRAGGARGRPHTAAPLTDATYASRHCRIRVP